MIIIPEILKLNKFITLDYGETHLFVDDNRVIDGHSQGWAIDYKEGFTIEYLSDLTNGLGLKFSDLDWKIAMHKEMIRTLNKCNSIRKK